jgi:hypothetical protein
MSTVLRRSIYDIDGVLRMASFLSRKCGEAAVMLAFFCHSR